MIELTFEDYLTDYVQRLSYCESTDVQKLAIEAGLRNFRLRAPLLLYAIHTDQTALLLQALYSEEFAQRRKEHLEDYKKKNLERWYQRAVEDDFAQYCADFLAKYNKSNLEQLLIKESDKLEIEYHKCWNSYNVRKHLLQKYGERAPGWARYSAMLQKIDDESDK